MRRGLAILPVVAALVSACGSGDERASLRPPASAVPADAGADAETASVGHDAGPTCTGLECSRLKLAFTRIFMGDTDRGGKTAHSSWQNYGENLDGLSSSYALNGECIPAGGPSAFAPSDGQNGIDNVWGQRMLPLLERWDPAPSKASDDALASGARRPIITLGELGGGLDGARLRASFTYVRDGQTEPELALFEAATFEHGTFDSGPSAAPITIELVLGAEPLRVKVQRLRVRFELLPDGTAIGGQLSGAIAITDLQSAVVDHVGRSAPVECGGQRLDDAKKAIADAADVHADGRSDRNATCDAISFGVGFEAAPLAVVGTRAAAPPLTPPCP